MIRTIFLPLVTNFHRGYKVREYEMLSFTPSNVLNFRADLIQQEEKEYNDATNVTELLDAICDLFYVIVGAAHITNTPLADLKPTKLPGSSSIVAAVDDVVDELQAPIPCNKRLPMFFNALNKQLMNVCGQNNFGIKCAFIEVHRTNMAKFWTEQDLFALPAQWTYTESGIPGRFIVKDVTDKIRKPPTWKEPNLMPFIGGAIIKQTDLNDEQI